MSDSKNDPKPETSAQKTKAGVPPHELPEVKSLVEKASADPVTRIPQGTVKTGADLPGGGGTKTLDHDPEPRDPQE